MQFLMRQRLETSNAGETVLHTNNVLIMDVRHCEHGKGLIVAKILDIY